MNAFPGIAPRSPGIDSVTERGNSPILDRMKSLCATALRNFLVANLCAVVPLWAAVFGWLPDEVRVYMQKIGSQTVRVVADGAVLAEEYCGRWEKGHIWRFYLHDGMAWKDLAFRLPPGVGPDAVARIERRKWRLFRLSWTGRGLERVAQTDDEFAFGRPRPGRPGIVPEGPVLALGILEALLLGAAFAAARWYRPDRAGRKALLRAAAGVGLALAALTHLALPVSSFVANRSAFPFGPGELALELAWRFPLAWGLAAAALYLLARGFGQWILAPVLAFALCAHLESGVLAGDLPALNGDWTFFADRAKAWRDAGIWAGVAVAVAALHPLLEGRYGRAGLCLALLEAGSLLGVRPEGKADASKLAVDGFAPIRAVLRTVSYSTNHNVMVFVIDSLEREQAHAVMEDPEAGPGLRERFRGFTEYTNNVGACSASLTAVANLFTGGYPETAAGLFDFHVSPYSRQSALCGFLDAGYAVSMATEALGYGYSNRGVTAGPAPAPARARGTGGVWRTPGRGGGGWSLANLGRFRWLPFAAKAPCAGWMVRGSPAEDFETREWKVYPLLQAAEPDPALPGTLLFVHTAGVHIPVFYNRHGESLVRPGTSEEACTELGVFLMQRLGDLFDVFREKDLYDRSLILVLADHGRHDEGAEPGRLPSNGRPFLWVKPAGSTHPFRTSPLPTSHANIHALLRAAGRDDLPEDAVEAILRSDRRRYFRLLGGMGPGWKEWIVGPDGDVLSSGTGELAARDPAGMRPMATGIPYSLDRSELGKNDLDIAFENIEFWPSPVLATGKPAFSFAFRVPDPGRRYALHIALRCQGRTRMGEIGSAMKFRQAAPDRDWTVLPLESHAGLVLHDLVPGPDGRIGIDAERGPGIQPPVFLTQLMLEPEP